MSLPAGTRKRKSATIDEPPTLPKNDINGASGSDEEFLFSGSESDGEEEELDSLSGDLENPQVSDSEDSEEDDDIEQHIRSLKPRQHAEGLKEDDAESEFLSRMDDLELT